MTPAIGQERLSPVLQRFVESHVLTPEIAARINRLPTPALQIQAVKELPGVVAQAVDQLCERLEQVPDPVRATVGPKVVIPSAAVAPAEGDGWPGFFSHAVIAALGGEVMDRFRTFRDRRGMKGLFIVSAVIALWNPVCRLATAPVRWIHSSARGLAPAPKPPAAQVAPVVPVVATPMPVDTRVPAEAPPIVPADPSPASVLPSSRKPELKVEPPPAPPAAPTGLASIGWIKTQRWIKWDAVPDAVSYNIYLLKDGRSEKLNAEPVIHAVFGWIPARGESRLSVTAVDAQGRESPPSAPATLR